MTGSARTLATAVLLLLCPPLLAQAPPEAPRDEAPAPADPSATVRRAVDRLAAGEAEEAVSLLESLPEEETPPQVRALLGTAYFEAGRPADAMEILGPLAEADGADPAVLYNAGRAATALGDQEQAARYLERSLALQSGTPAARELGLLRGQQGRMREAYRLLRPWASTHPDDTEARLATALAAIRLERVADAEEILDGVPLDSPRARLLTGKLRQMQADPRGAVAVLKPALEQGAAAEEELDIRRTLAGAYLAIGEAAEAVALLAGHDDGHPATALELAKAKYQLGEIERAIELLAPHAQRLLELSRERGELRANTELGAEYALEYGRLLSTAGRREEALPYLELTTELDPSQKEAWQMLGQTLAALGRRDEATEALERFQELARAEGATVVREERKRQDAADPTGREMRRAMALMGTGRHGEALAVVQAEKELAPDDIRPWLLESRILLLEDRPAEALLVAQETVRRFPDYVDAYYQRGTAHLAMESYEQAEEDFRRALDLDPDHVPSMNDLAVMLIVLDREAEARRLLERVLELNPDDPRARETLERLEADGG